MVKGDSKRGHGQMKFTKMQGAGNDYVYVDARKMEEDWPSLARQMSDRHFGIGSDGLILVQDSEVADLKMRMFNADGSEGEMCGNGIRCFAKYALEHGVIDGSPDTVTVDTLAGIRQVAPVVEKGRVTRARVSMGMPRFHPEEIPVVVDPDLCKEGWPFLQYPVTVRGSNLAMSFVSMGNPHAIAFIEQPVAEFPLHTVGPLVEHHQMFPRRVNFEIVNRTVNSRGDNALTARVWERGSAETMACGTGACAIAVASRLLGHTGDSVEITLPGGTLTIEWDGRGEVYLEGPAEEVFSGEWNKK